MIKLPAKIRTWFSTWQGKRPLLDGWLPRAGLSISLLSFLFSINSSIKDNLNVNVVESLPISLILSTFGFILLGLANIIYLVFRDPVLRYSDDPMLFSEFCMKYWSFQDFLDAHAKIQANKKNNSGNPDFHYLHRTAEEFFSMAAHPNYKTRFTTLYPSMGFDNLEFANDFNGAKEKYQSLIISISRAYYEISCQRKPYIIRFILALAIIGYILAIIPQITRFFSLLLQNYL